MNRSSWVRAVGPASLSNLGPGFDALGLCIDTHRDVVEALFLPDGSGVSVDEVAGLNEQIPIDPDKNTAAIAASAVLRQGRMRGGLRLRIKKGIPLGSGIGGSAASAVAGAVAAAAVLGVDPKSAVVLRAALEGEAAASGDRHGDNVLPSLVGGFVVTMPGDPECYQRISVAPPPPPSLALALPSIPILTEHARSILPREVAFSKAIRNAAASAAIVAAVANGDWRSFGANIMADQIVEPIRGALVRGFGEAREAALKAGAHGAALSGSGPAIFAVCDDDGHAGNVARAMVEALNKVGTDAATYIAHPSNRGCVTEAS